MDTGHAAKSVQRRMGGSPSVFRACRPVHPEQVQEVVELNDSIQVEVTVARRSSANALLALGVPNRTHATQILRSGAIPIWATDLRANHVPMGEEFHLATAAESRVELGRIVGTTVSAFFDISLGLLARLQHVVAIAFPISIHVCVPDTRTLTTAKATLVEDIACTVACTSSDDTFTVVAPHLSRQVHTATCGIGDGN